jgi:hypothetical protein
MWADNTYEALFTPQIIRTDRTSSQRKSNADADPTLPSF